MTARSHRTLLQPALTLLFAALLLRFPPGQYPFYPQRPFYAWTHLLCPGCGATRAVAALLRGHLAEALQDNALVVAAAPFLLSYLALRFYLALRSDRLCWHQPPRWTLPAAFAITTVFALARNFPPAPFTGHVELEPRANPAFRLNQHR